MCERDRLRKRVAGVIDPYYWQGELDEAAEQMPGGRIAGYRLRSLRRADAILAEIERTYDIVPKERTNAESGIITTSQEDTPALRQQPGARHRKD